MWCFFLNSFHRFNDNTLTCLPMFKIWDQVKVWLCDYNSQVKSQVLTIYQIQYTDPCLRLRVLFTWTICDIKLTLRYLTPWSMHRSVSQSHFFYERDFSFIIFSSHGVFTITLRQTERSGSIAGADHSDRVFVCFPQLFTQMLEWPLLQDTTDSFPTLSDRFTWSETHEVNESVNQCNTKTFFLSNKWWTVSIYIFYQQLEFLPCYHYLRS